MKEPKEGSREVHEQREIITYGILNISLPLFVRVLIKALRPGTVQVPTVLYSTVPSFGILQLPLFYLQEHTPVSTM